MCVYTTETTHMFLHMHIHTHAPYNTQTLECTPACAYLMPASLLSPSLSICPWTGKSPNYTQAHTPTHTQTEPFLSSWLLVFSCQLFVRVFGRIEFVASTSDMERCEQNHEKK